MNILKKKISSELGEQLYALEKEVFTRDFDLPSRSLQEFNEFFSKSDFLVSQDGDKIVGFMAFEKDNQSIEIKIIAILVSNQRKGIGQALLKEIFTENQGKLIYLTVHPKNSSAIAFYLKCGFDIARRIENCYGDGQPRLRLEKQL